MALTPDQIQSSMAYVLTGTGGAAGFVIAWRLLAQWLRRDSVNAAKDRAETNIINTLERDNERLRDEIQILSRERNETYAANGKLQAQVEMFTEMIKKLEADIAANEVAMRETASTLRQLEIENAKLKLEQGMQNGS